VVLCPLTKFYKQYTTPDIFKTNRKKQRLIKVSTGLGDATLPFPVLLVGTYEQDAEYYHTI